MQNPSSMRNPRLLVRGRVSLTRTIVVNQRGERINPTVFIYLQILHQLGSIFSQHKTIKHKHLISIIAGGSTFDKLRDSQQPFTFSATIAKSTCFGANYDHDHYHHHG